MSVIINTQTTTNVIELSETFVMSRVSAVTTPPPSQPDDVFLNLNDSQYYPLATTYGFNRTEFNAAVNSNNVITVSAMTQSALQFALNSLGVSGGKVIVPAGTINITSRLDIPSRVILEGAGIGQTIFALSGSSAAGLRAVNQSHIILRNFTVDGIGCTATNNLSILLQRTHNCLLEYVDCKNSNLGSNLVFNTGARKTTIRYCEFSNAFKHGINSKDFFPDEANDQLPPGPYDPNDVTTDFQMYSCYTHNNGNPEFAGGYGIDLHSSYGEIAGCLVENNYFGMKLPDVSNVYIHRNRFTGAVRNLHKSVNDANHPVTSSNQVFYKNEFSGAFNDQPPEPEFNPWPVRFDGFGTGSYKTMYDIFFVDNTYINQLNEFRNASDMTEWYVCPDTQDASLSVSGNPYIVLSQAECDSLIAIFQ